MANGLCCRCGEKADGAHRSWCKACAAAYYRAKRATNREEHNAKARAWIQANPEKRRGYRRQNLLRNKYGMEVIDYNALLEAQDGCCAICRVPEAEAPKARLFVDHNHENGKVRGLLCSKCNFSIGHMDEDVARIHRMASYLLRHAEPRMKAVK